MNPVRRWLFPAPHGSAETPPFSLAAWHRTVVVVHAAFGVFIVVGVLAAALDRGDHPGRAPWAYAALGVLTLAYVLAGASGLADRRPGRAVAYLLALVVVLAVVAWANPGLLFVLFLAFTQVWMLVDDWRPGLAWTVVLAATTTVGLVLGRQGGDDTFSAVVSMVVGLVFSIAIGLFVALVMRQSEQRAGLIATLEATRAELAEVHHDAGVAAERVRLAREVHDTLAQGYTSIVVLTQTARAELAAGQAQRADERLAVVEDVARDNLREARALVAATSPPALDDAGLAQAVERLAQRHTRETGVPVAVTADPVRLDRDREVVLLRAAQEALVNVRRHAEATYVSVALCNDDDRVALQVVDDGKGFDPSSVGIGLAGLARRAREVGGAADVVSTPGAGTTVTVRVPTA
jgi:signal transduction histidine kinase